MKAFRWSMKQFVFLLLSSFLADAASCCTDTHVHRIRTAGTDTPVNGWEVVLFNIDTTELRREQIVQDCEMMLRLRASTRASSEVRAKDDVLEIELNTAATPPKTGNLNPIMLDRSFIPPAKPWARSGSLFAHANVTVNTFRTVDRAVAYVQIVLLVLDQVSNRQFWVSVQIWDPRGFEIGRYDWLAGAEAKYGNDGHLQNVYGASQFSHVSRRRKHLSTKRRYVIEFIFRWWMAALAI